MKKLMIALGAVAVAVGVQAAQVDWEVTKASIKDYGGTALQSANAYLVLATAGDAFDTFKAGLAAGTINANNIMDESLYLGKGVSGSTSKKAGIIDKTSSDNSGSLTAGSFYDLVYVTFDKVNGTDYYYLSGPQQGQAWGGSEYTQDLVQKASWSTYSADNWHAVSAVPEPTSGLLLLLGVAGLALRRRRA